MKKLLKIALSLSLTLTMLGGISACDETEPAPNTDPAPLAQNNDPAPNADPAPEKEAKDAPAPDADPAPAPDASASVEEKTITGAIAVVSREASSGTRGAFVELFDVREEVNGKKVDATVGTAEIIDSTGGVISSVEGNERAIGYCSLGSLKETIKPLKVEGVTASVETILDGSYKISRPFNLVLQDKEQSELVADFLAYIMSEEGQEVVTADKYITEGNNGAYTGGGLSGKITVEGSSSVSPLMEKLIEAYQVLNPDVNIELQTNDSGTGINSAIAGTCDIGMASRELKDEEISQGVSPEVICLDGVVVIVNKANAMNDISKAAVRSIFLGETTKWEDVG